jgi:hypothetical protein
MSSAIEQINTLLASLSFAEKLTLNEQIAGALRKEGGGVKPVATKAGKKSKKDAEAGSDTDAETKPKRKAAVGTLAWTAFVKHIKETRPEAFADVKKESDKLTVVKGIRADNMPAYESFVAEWKEKYAASEKSETSSFAEQAEEAVPAPVPYSDWAAPAKPKTAAEKLAEVKAAKAAEKAAKEAAASAPAPAAAPAAAAAPAPAPTPTPKKPVKTVKAEAPKKAVKAAAEAKATEEPQMDQIEIDGKMYWHDPATNGLWEVTGKTFAEGSNWMGYYQPENDEEPIRYTEAFGDE